ncbi:glycosyltransferase family 4 protein [Vibrio alginolyticus]|uniref:glycosyltransferase family 4 protein n=1 Tax=Vibrio alginolyticus TaxID=663 RepID=UPI00148DE9C7|nr:glycosyltransferase family 4 protein [Vibrio alginolyticus]MCS0296606.1 hypothetical protein [Vibrio alginolyticus]NOI43104.1 glycosyltransferase family 4 protein [Vibrio alginolyticus]
MTIRILVMVEDYPREEKPYAMGYVHSRSIEYIKRGISVDVLCFSASQEYTYEGVNIKSCSSCIEWNDYAAVVSHAPNIKNHFNLLNKHIKKIKNLIFFFHGHEIMKMNEYYPKPYPELFIPKDYFKSIFSLVYDRVKLKYIKYFINANQEKIKCIFVSNWMKEVAFTCLGVKKLPVSHYVIPNPINTIFTKSSYKNPDNKKVITIRPFDNPKYGIDLVLNVAKVNPSFEFHIYGSGTYLDKVYTPDNVKVIKGFIEQKNIPMLLNDYEFALMPTRLDAQGVMMCEMATYGITTITSDLPVCYENLSDYKNVFFMSNNIDEVIDLKVINHNDESVNVNKFMPSSIVDKELIVFFE